MRTGYASLLSSLLFLTCRTSANFILKDKFVGQDFLSDRWSWFTDDDPTHGRVNYVNKDTALATNLSYAEPGKFIMRADEWSVVRPEARGRDSVRIVSNDAYDDAIFVLDLHHMPEGCSTWPAFWTLSQAGPWPHGGEIDIIEGVNLNGDNLASLHTLPSCTMAPDRRQQGNTVSTDCNTEVNYNQGCGVTFDKPANSYGTNFNNNQGGFYVMSKTHDKGVQVWFWSRFAGWIPPEIQFGGENIYPNPTWGTPAATFPMDMCDYDSHFNAHQMVFDLTFCGDWAGAGTVWSSSGCGTGSCQDFVDNNPGAFAKAYWEINALRVYTPKQW
ncbi:glycoside hydrolase family 16 protein [Auriscalpium vulgare]|uniref:Glycoside hydrolase family 16 protein n=1 Tax=Auriscalpium vulgare TaxID=40419 RepID=A0ACB8RQS9_9AGAM|nr:glycoside hydrolase family 16 protein [Auriscalpium vulgare]